VSKGLSHREPYCLGGGLLCDMAGLKLLQLERSMACFGAHGHPQLVVGLVNCEVLVSVAGSVAA
jgi:hypothetical protein